MCTLWTVITASHIRIGDAPEQCKNYVWIINWHVEKITGITVAVKLLSVYTLF